jgi:uracil phosphoribosyltransferase
MIIHHLSFNNSILNHFLAEIRDIQIQNDRMRFRKNMERIGELMAYEVSKVLQYKSVAIQTPLGIKHTHSLKDQLVICSILRAGLALHTGFMNIFDGADNGFISAKRQQHPIHNGEFEILVEYQAIPFIESKTLILLDPMLATGHSMVSVIQKIMAQEKPKEFHLVVVIAAPEGVAYLEKNLPPNCHLWIAALDEKLNENHYIVPGLGDAGDLAYGNKF